MESAACDWSCACCVSWTVLAFTSSSSWPACIARATSSAEARMTVAFPQQPFARRLSRASSTEGPASSVASTLRNFRERGTVKLALPQ